MFAFIQTRGQTPTVLKKGFYHFTLISFFAFWILARRWFHRQNLRWWRQWRRRVCRGGGDIGRGWWWWWRREVTTYWPRWGGFHSNQSQTDGGASESHCSKSSAGPGENPGCWPVGFGWYAFISDSYKFIGLTLDCTRVKNYRPNHIYHKRKRMKSENRIFRRTLTVK